MFFTDIHDEKISASNMKEAAIKAILLAYYKDLAHSTNYLKLSKIVKKADSINDVVETEEWKDYKFERPMAKTHVMIYGKRKNTCYQLSSFNRVGLEDVQIYLINRRKIVLPLKNIDVEVVSGKFWKTKNVGHVAKLIESEQEIVVKEQEIVVKEEPKKMDDQTMDDRPL